MSTPQQHLWGLSWVNPRSCMAYKMRRCTGLSPSRASGRARPTMTDIAYCDPDPSAAVGWLLSG